MKNFSPNDNFIWYLYWICERQDIFWRRYNGEQAPYSEDEIFNQYKFTNVYKSLDRSTQFEFKNVIYNGNKYSKEDMFYRILVYKHFNLPDTWKLLVENLGDITIKNTSFEDISFVINEYQKIDPDFKPYSNAYMLTAAFLAGQKGKYVHLKGNGWKKHQYYFHIFNQEIFNNGYLDKIISSVSLEDLYNKLIKITSFADFLTYQYIIDLNYSEIFNFDENSFAMAGLGTVRGIDRTFDFVGKPNYEEVIHWVQQNFEQLLEDYSKKYDVQLNFKSLPNHLPTVPDLSNCFCETAKYLKVMNPFDTPGEKRMKNKFNQSLNKIGYIFPPKWNVNI